MTFDFDPGAAFGEEIAERYDDFPRGDESETVAFLKSLAGDAAVLEFAIGTGRIALPLQAAGLRVDGIELSEAMVRRLRSKPGGECLTVVQGDMSIAVLDGRYRLVYLVYNTIFNLLAQDDQVRCFENAAHHLDDSGVFVVEAAVVGEWFRHDREYVEAERIGSGEVTLDVGQYDPVTQHLRECHVTLSPRGLRLAPIVTRYASPGELDLMARIAGLRLRDRWGGWNHEPFTRHSRRHVSVYERAD